MSGFFYFITMENQTAVEWLVGELLEGDKSLLPLIIGQALQMEKEQIIKAYLSGESDGDHLINSGKIYYRETYGGI